MNCSKVDELMELHYEARKCLQRAKEADFNRREMEICLSYHQVKESPAMTGQYLKKVRLATDQREYHLKQYAEAMDKIAELIGEDRAGPQQMGCVELAELHTAYEPQHTADIFS